MSTRTHRMSGNQLLSKGVGRGSRSTWGSLPREWLLIPSALMSQVPAAGHDDLYDHDVVNARPVLRV